MLVSETVNYHSYIGKENKRLAKKSGNVIWWIFPPVWLSGFILSHWNEDLSDFVPFHLFIYMNNWCHVLHFTFI